MTHNKAAFAAALRAARRSRGLSVSEAARRVGVTRQSWHAWENATAPTWPQGDRWNALEAVLGVEAATLQGFAPPAEPPGADYPRHLEGAVKRLEADLDDSPLPEDLRRALGALLRAPDLVARYWHRWREGTQTEAEQRQLLEAHLTRVRLLLDGMLREQDGAGPTHAIPVDEVGPAWEPPATDVRRRGKGRAS